MLLSLPPEEIKKLIDSYDNQCIEIKRSALQLSWYLRGGVSYEDVLNMSVKEREMIVQIAKNNLEVTKNSSLPYF